MLCDDNFAIVIIHYVFVFVFHFSAKKSTCNFIRTSIMKHATKGSYLNLIKKKLNRVSSKYDKR